MSLKTGVLRKQSTTEFPKNKNFLPPTSFVHVQWKNDGSMLSEVEELFNDSNDDAGK